MVKKNKHTCKWRVTFENIAYDGGGCESWTQYYWTKTGARFSRFWHLHFASWGGKATLYKVAS